MVRIVWLLMAVCLAGCAGSRGHVADVRGHLPDLRFRLTDDQGRAVTAQAFRGQVLLVYFGYTGCGAECPVTLAHLAGLMPHMSPAPRVLFVSVTPQIDQPAVLHAYLNRFDPAHMTGLTGGATEALARDLRAAWPQPGGGGHGNLVYVFDGQGRARFLITPDATDSDALRAIGTAGHG